MENIKTITLSRELITGSLDSDDIPDVVYREIASIYDIEFVDNIIPVDAIISACEKASKVPITLDTNSKYLREVAKFINPNEMWTNKELLLDAYRFIIKFMKDEDTALPQIGITFDVGLQTQSTPHSLNACMLFRLCKHNNLSTYLDTTIDQMVNSLRMLKMDNFMQQSIMFNTLKNIPFEDLPYIYLYLSRFESNGDDNSDTDTDGHLQSLEISYDEMKETIQYFSDVSKLYQRFRPKTVSEAVAIAGYVYDVDISSASDIFSEFTHLTQAPNSYEPKDEIMLKKWKKNNTLFNLNFVFNPYFPENIYKIGKLDSLARFEGYVNSTEEGPYSFLQTVYVEDTFYFGVMDKNFGIEENIAFQTYIYGDSIDELPEKFIISYGSRETNFFAYFTYEELIQLFSNNKNFSSPIPFHDIFSKTSITKLKNMCYAELPTDTEEILLKKRSLLASIAQVEIYVNEKNTILRRFREEYLECSFGMRNEIETAVSNLFKLSMCMRGWLKDNDELPIDSAPVGSNDQYLVIVRVTEKIIEFEKNVNSLPPYLGKMIMDLPLYKYHTNREFHPISSAQGELTVREKLELVKGGESLNEASIPDTCIRMSSNILATSVYRYMQILGMSIPFDIEKLRSIS